MTKSYRRTLEDEVEMEVDRIMKMNDKEILAEHLKMFGGDQKLANKSIAMMKSKIIDKLARTTKH